tara:strand:- start:733 stop:993 length:261 start_codon:yes stop_codon:yes gene_type:complete
MLASDVKQSLGTAYCNKGLCVSDSNISMKWRFICTSYAMEGWIGTTTSTFAEAPRIDKNINNNNMLFLYWRDNNIVDFATLLKKKK